MSEYDAENREGYPRENQVKRGGAQPGLEKFPLLPKKISNQNVAGGPDRRSREVVKEKDSPWYFCHACQDIRHKGRKQRDEPRNKNSLGAMTFEKSLGPL